MGGDVGRAGLLHVNQRGGVVVTDSPDLARRFDEHARARAAASPSSPA